MLFVILVNMTWGTMKKGLPPGNEMGHSEASNYYRVIITPYFKRI